MDASTGKIAAYALTDGKTNDAVQTSTLLWQAEDVIGSLTATSADTGSNLLKTAVGSSI